MYILKLDVHYFFRTKFIVDNNVQVKLIVIGNYVSYIVHKVTKIESAKNLFEVN